jgi:hypothetical protein
MSLPNILLMECSKCRVAASCPKKGSSPLKLPSGQEMTCRLVGGYGRNPVDQSILSEDSKKLSKEHGPCLTIAEVPILDECSGLAVYQITKIFAPPVLHEREVFSEDQMKAMLIKNQCAR